MTEETTPTTPPQDQDPAKGGSYLRQEDGSLALVEATEPAKPAAATQPPAAATSQE